MNKNKQKQLREKGWTVGSVDEFLELTPEESAYIELKLTLATNLRQRRRDQQLTQMELAKLLHSSQSRVAKIESGDPSVSLDLLVRSLLTLGATHSDLAHMISPTV
ncbi:MAG: helix-turn-helix domain-containing protein [Aquificales bacterium]|nr:helix-turn-helix domain-containing protein [Aquificales bacterium]